jgi:hypothetical protein
MKFSLGTLAAGAFLSTLGVAVPVSNSNAASITVDNASFETIPSAGLPNPDGFGGIYSYQVAIPDWQSFGEVGQWQPADNGHFFTTAPPDGSTIAFINDGMIWQTLSPTAQAGVTYALTVYRTVSIGAGWNGVVSLVIGGDASGGELEGGTGASDASAPTVAGTWQLDTITYTATAADAGKSIAVRLASSNGNNFSQSDWDDISLSDSIPVSTTPLPAALPLFAGGLGALGLFGCRRKRKAGAFTA